MRKESELEGLDVFHLERGLEVLHKRRKDSLERYPDRKDDEVAEKVYQLRQKFIRASILMTEDEAIICTKLYVEHIAGVKWDDEDMLNKVGRRCNGLDEKTRDDAESFWKELNASIPGFLTDDEAKWLVNVDTSGYGAFQLLCRLDFNHPTAIEPSAVMSSIVYWK